MSVDVTTDRLVWRTAAGSRDVRWGTVDAVVAHFARRGRIGLTVWQASADTVDTADREPWRIDVPSATAAHALSRMYLACASAASSRDAYLAGLADSGVPYRVTGPASTW